MDEKLFRRMNLRAPSVCVQVLNLLLALLSTQTSVRSSQAQRSTPLTLSYQGELSGSSGQVINGELRMTFKLYRVEIDGEAIWAETHNAVIVEGGRFQVDLGLITPLPLNGAPNSPLFLALELSGDEEVRPRLRVGATIRAQWSERAIHASIAEHASDVRGEEIHPASVSIGDRAVIDALGRWVGEPISDARATPTAGTVIYTRCAWTADTSTAIGSCTPPSCPNAWTELGITGNVKTAVTQALATHSAYHESAGYSERGCLSRSPRTILIMRCAWSGDMSSDIGNCSPPSCPEGWTNLGVTGNVKTSVAQAIETHPAYQESSGYQERTCAL